MRVTEWFTWLPSATISRKKDGKVDIDDDVESEYLWPEFTFPSTHNMGTCRMSANARDGVCNSTGATHDVPNLFISDGSQFTTGAACNPTLTIVSLAIRQAENMTNMLSQNTI